MPRSTSVFLDGLRLLAALIVFEAHLDFLLWHIGGWVPSHLAVMVFFVLSGYVIAFTTLGQGSRKAGEYVVARFSRLYSVVLPALLLTAVLHALGRTLGCAGYEPGEMGRILTAGAFLQSVWSLDGSPVTNHPFWSLSYEFWYYVLFGMCVFGKRRLPILAGVLAVIVIIGPSILLLLPVWAIGVGAYIWRDRAVWVSPRLAAVGFVLCPVALLAFRHFVPQFPGTIPEGPFRYAAAFVTDWSAGLSFGGMIWCFNRAFADVKCSTALEKPLRWGAGHTFSLYLYHYPLIFFVAALGIIDRRVWWEDILVVALVLGASIVLSELTESQRNALRHGLAYAQQKLVRLWAQDGEIILSSVKFDEEISCTPSRL